MNAAAGGRFEDLRRFLAGRAPGRIAAGGAAEAAVALVLAPGEAGAEILLLRRATREGDPWSGHVALPGGRREPKDPDLFATAVRESREETGIALAPGSLLGELDEIFPSTRITPPIVVRPFVFGLPARPAVAASAEIAFHFWTPLEELRAAAARSEVTVGGERRSVPSYRIAGEVVWGMTWRVLEGFLGVARGEE